MEKRFVETPSVKKNLGKENLGCKIGPLEKKKLGKLLEEKKIVVKKFGGNMGPLGPNCCEMEKPPWKKLGGNFWVLGKGKLKGPGIVETFGTLGNNTREKGLGKVGLPVVKMKEWVMPGDDLNAVRANVM